MKLFKIRASCIGKIMGRVGLTEKQLEELKTLSKRDHGEGRALTDNQKNKLLELREKYANPKLPETCTSYLKEWYAEQRYGDKRELNTKYTNKGNECEYEAIGMVEEMEEKSFLVKNETDYENDFMTGTPDIVSDIIYDTKCPWDSVTFLNSISSNLNTDYEWQMRGYMLLANKNEAKVCYCLVNTPEEVNYGVSVSYDTIPKSDKYFTFLVVRDTDIEGRIIERVELCRKWLEGYDNKINSLIGDSNV